MDVMQAIQQLSGINTVMYYAGTIVVMAGFTDVSLAIWITAVIGFVGFASTFVGLFLVERAGRRCLTLGSLLGDARPGFVRGGDADAKAAGPAASFTVKVTNTGALDAGDVVLGFLGPPGAGKDGVPLQTLFGFERVFVKAGEAKEVTISPEETMLTHVVGCRCSIQDIRICSSIWQRFKISNIIKMIFKYYQNIEIRC